MCAKKRTAIQTVGMIVILAVASAFSAAQDRLTQQELDASRAVWDSLQLTDYKYEFHRLCFCISVGPVAVDVRDNEVAHALFLKDDEVLPNNHHDTIDDLFDTLQRAIDQPADAISASFDPLMGFPSEINVDWSFMIADEEWSSRIYGVTENADPLGCDDLCRVNYLIDTFESGWYGVEIFDFDENQKVDFDDLSIFVDKNLQTSFGDANLDGQFNSSDLVAVFEASEYEDGIAKNSRWESGDWNGDRDFTTSDLTLAFQADRFEKGPRDRVQNVPEPNSKLLVMMVCMFGWLRARRC